MASDMVLGLDLFRPFFRTVTFDYDAKQVTFSKTETDLALSSIGLTQDGKFYVDVRVGDVPAKMLIDTGSKGNTVSPDYAHRAPGMGYRLYQRRWESFDERLIPLSIGDDAPQSRWVQVRDFATDGERGIIGVLGKINGGPLTIDFQDSGAR